MELIKTVVNGKIRIYQKKIKRKLKNGTLKTYNTVQQIVSLEKNDSFYDGQKVMVLAEYGYIDILKEAESSANLKKELKNIEERYTKLQKTHQDTLNELDRLRNKHDHLQERLRVALGEINFQQKIVTDLSNRSFLDYLCGKKPESLKLMEYKRN